MNINKSYYISEPYTSGGSGDIHTNLFGSAAIFNPDNTLYNTLHRILDICRKRKYSAVRKNEELVREYNASGLFDMTMMIERLFPESTEESNADLVKRVLNSIVFSGGVLVSHPEDDDDDETVADAPVAEATAEPVVPAKTEAEVKAFIKSCRKFFSEFHYSPSLRFIRTFALIKKGDRKKFVKSYFEVQDHQSFNEIREKVKSAEFDALVDDVEDCFNGSPVINSRLSIYYGEPGTGKTTAAVAKSKACIVCSSDMLPVDLMQNFAFNDGKAAFEKSDLWKAMENGETICLDEINMLPFESLRYLQGITDGKSEVDYKGHKITVKEGFHIIGTMNLYVNGQISPLPEPLVDRCANITEFELSDGDIYKALCG